MPSAAKQFFHQKVVEELHVGSGEGNRWIRAVIQPALALEFGKVSRKLLSQLLCQILKHLAEMLVLKLQHVNVHKQPVVLMFIHQSSNCSSKTHQLVRSKRLIEFREQVVQSGIDYFLIAADDGFQNLFFSVVVVVHIAERDSGTCGNSAHRGSMKALLDKKLLGRFLNP